ncbi:beta-lactamase/transpeptidase-like protein [Tanacetum coccineum]|uniref:Beta-lactamase/transpeptidase-like protein n=1 Tax=Tanacetum coccineum TaxID=301880 RepID=A0ABQ4YSR4_9ASTR
MKDRHIVRDLYEDLELTGMICEHLKVHSHSKDLVYKWLEENIESVIGINKDDIDEEDDESSTMEPPSRNEAIKAAITLNNFLLSYEKTTPEVNHILNHTSGLHNALAGISEEDPTLFCDFDECIKRIAMHASGKKFQDVLEEAFIRPLNIEGELYIGIPPGVESRLATISLDTNKASRIGKHAERPERKRSGTASIPVPSLLTLKLISTFISLSNTLSVRRAILPAFNLHASARALARYYAALVDVDTKIFTNTKVKIHDAFLGIGDYKDSILPDGNFRLGFLRIKATDGNVIGFGHSGLGGSTGYCDINNRFAISVTLNLASSGALTGEIIRFICSELDLPVPKDYAESRDFTGNPKIN